MGYFSLGVIVDSFKQGFQKGVEIAARMGFDGIQMYMVSGEFAPEAVDHATIARVKTILSDNAMAVSAVCGDLGGHGFSKKEDNARKIAITKQILQNAQSVGTNIVTTHIGVIPQDERSSRYEILQETCTTLGLYADSLDMKLAIETGPETAPVLKKFLDSLPCKGMRVNLDPANFVMVTGQDPAQAVDLLRDYIVHTHAKDGKMLSYKGPEYVYHAFAEGGVDALDIGSYLEETPLGQGSVDFDAYLDALRKIGYHGYLTIEREVGDTPQLDIELALTLLKSKNQAV
jgi:sugar phosphate isomerase/epimerase